MIESSEGNKKSFIFKTEYIDKFIEEAKRSNKGINFSIWTYTGSSELGIFENPKTIYKNY